MWRATVIALVFFLSSSFPPTPFAWSLELAATGWRQNPSGNLTFGDGHSSDDLDLREDLDYGVQNRVGGRLKVGLPLLLPNLYLVAMPSKFEGTGQKETDFRFGNRRFEGNVDFHSELKLDQYDVALFYGLPFLKTATRGTFGAEIGVNLRVMDVDMTVSQTAVSRSESATVVVPMLYLGLRLQPAGWLAIELEGRGLTYREDHAYTLLGRVSTPLFGPVFGTAGYRYDFIDLEEIGIAADFSLYGPFLEIGLHF
jgi:outer membrane protein